MTRSTVTAAIASAAVALVLLVAAGAAGAPGPAESPAPSPSSSPTAAPATDGALLARFAAAARDADAAVGDGLAALDAALLAAGNTDPAAAAAKVSEARSRTSAARRVAQTADVRPCFADARNDLLDGYAALTAYLDDADAWIAAWPVHPRLSSDATARRSDAASLRERGLAGLASAACS